MELASTGASPAHRAELPSWWGSILAVIAGSIAAWALLILLALPLALLHVIPVGYRSGEAGWPWRVDGPWSLAADAGPTLAAGLVVAFCVAFYLESRTGVRPRRWPLALVAVTVGWLPVMGGARGVIAVSGAVAFVAIVFTARRWALAERRPLRWTRPAAVATLVAGLALAAASASYGALHPLAAESAHGGTVVLTHGHTGKLDLAISNRGPLDARVLGVSIPDTPGVRVERVPAGARLHSGQDLVPMHLNIAAAGCARGEMGHRWAVHDLDLRLRVAGLTRTQSAHLSPPLRVVCR